MTDTSKYYKSSDHIFTNNNKTPNIYIRPGRNETLIIDATITGSLVGAALTENNILIGDENNQAKEVVVSGDISLDLDGIVTLSDTGVIPGSYTNTDLTVDSKGRITAAVSGTGSISTTLPENEIIIGNASNIAQAQTMSGDATIVANGTLTLTDTSVISGTYTPISITVDSKGRITNINNTLNSAYILIGSSSNTAVPRLITGDGTINNLGVLSLANTIGAITTYTVPTTFTFNEKGLLTSASTPSQIFNQIGAASTPSYAFIGSGAANSTGMWYTSVPITSLNFSSTGVLRFTLSQSGTDNYQKFKNISGTNADPSYTFTSNLTSGMYQSASNNIDFSCNSVNVLNLNTTSIVPKLPIYSPLGLVGSPSYTFISDPTSGMYQSASNNIDFSINSVNVLNMNATNIAPKLPFYARLGLVSAPSYSFTADTNTGIYSSGADNIDFTTNGVKRVNINNTFTEITNLLAIPSGVTGAATMGLYFSNDTDTGITNNNTNNQFQIVSAGGVRMSFESGSIRFFRPLYGDNGTVSLPTYSFQNGGSSGLYWDNTATSICTSMVGGKKLELTTTSYKVFVPIEHRDGTAGSPSITFGSSATSGMFWDNSNTSVGISVSGTRRIECFTTLLKSSVVLELPVGTVSFPSLYFAGDSLTGLYAPTTNQIGLACNSVAKMKVGSSGGFLADCAVGGSASLTSSDTNGTGLLVRGVYPQTPLQVESDSNSIHNLITFRSSLAGVNCGFVQMQIPGSSVSYLTSSDRRLKENIVPMASCLAKIRQLNCVSYDWKNSNGGKGEGLIAQELKEVFPKCVGGLVNPNDYYGVDYAKLTVPLIKALQESMTIIDSLTTRLAAVEAESASNKAKLLSLKLNVALLAPFL